MSGRIIARTWPKHQCVDFPGHGDDWMRERDDVWECDDCFKRWVWRGSAWWPLRWYHLQAQHNIHEWSRR